MVKAIRITKASLVLLFIAFTFSAAAQSDCYPPKPNGYVVDAANILTGPEEEIFNKKLQAFRDSTSNEIVVVTLEELCAGDAAMTAYEIGEKWAVGQKEFDNGIVILIKPTGGAGERRTFIATGYGLEGAIPDATAKLIVDREMIPAFKGGNYYAGIDQALDVLMELSQGEYSFQEYNKKKKGGAGIAAIFPILFFIGIWFFLLFRRTSSYARNNDLGFWAALALMNAASNRRHGGSFNSFSGGGFGGGGGGGFGGFGGGSFGGGGAGGSW